MPRFIRNTVILAKTEVTYGLDPTPSGAANALLVSNLSEPARRLGLFAANGQRQSGGVQFQLPASGVHGGLQGGG